MPGVQKSYRKIALAATFATAITWLTVACPFKPPNNGTGTNEVFDLTTPKGTLKTIEWAYNNRNIENYKNALKGDEFVFYFNPLDVGSEVNGYIIPESWTYTEDWRATNNMFERAYDIDLVITTEGIGAPAPGATEFEAKYVSIDLTVMTNESNGYRAYKGYCNFKFKNTGTEEEPKWRLVGWWDFTHD